MLLSRLLQDYRAAIARLPADQPLNRGDILSDLFLLERSGPIEIFYAPHNEYINPPAQVVIVGITPGWTQTRIAYETAREGLEQRLKDEEICRRAKESAGFAGSMRTHLIDMLDELQLHRTLSLSSCGELFAAHRDLLHTTSLLRFSVFLENKNYTGAKPFLLTVPLLRDKALAFIEEELKLLANQPLIVPLGKTVEGVLRILDQEGKLQDKRVLWGFPHPSGANGHRRRQFESNRERMQEILNNAF
ncbi:Uracil DNA glycosylase superfamily protein [compost metagenome]